MPVRSAMNISRAAAMRLEEPASFITKQLDAVTNQLDKHEIDVVQRFSELERHDIAALQRFGELDKRGIDVRQRVDALSDRLARHDTDVMRRIEVLTERFDAFVQAWEVSQVVPPGRWQRLVSWFSGVIHGEGSKK